MRLFHGVDRDDVGMAQGSDALCLTLETGAAFRGASRRIREDLEGNVAFQSRIARPIHLAHAAGAERRQNLISAEPSACHEGHETASEGWPIVDASHGWGKRTGGPDLPPLIQHRRAFKIPMRSQL